MANLALRKLSDSAGINLEESTILLVYTITGGARIEYLDELSGVRNSIKVANTPAEIAALSKRLVLLAIEGDTSAATYVNIERIVSITETNSKATVIYNAGGAEKARYVSTGTKATFQTAIYAKLAYYTYEVDSYSGDTIVLDSGAGDVTAKFVNGKTITIYGALDENNDTYVVDSSTFGGGETTITLSAGTGVSDDTDTTGRVMIKSLSNADLETEVQGIVDGTSEFDVINEKTTGAGVTVDGVLNKDGGITTTEINNYGAATAITAFATGGQSDAVVLAKDFNEITVCATAGDSVKLPTAVAGLSVTVKNNGATAADVFPATGDSIDTGGVNAAIRLAVGATMTFRAVDATVWESTLAAAGTVGNPSIPVGTTNKGFYEVSANQLGTSVNGALVAIADSEGLTADSFRHRVNKGTTPVGTVDIVEYGDGQDVTTVLTLTDFVIGALAGAGAALGLGNIAYAYPAGQHLELVSSFTDIVLTAAGTAVTTDTGLGSVIASGAVSVLSGTTTFEDRLTGQAIDTDPTGGAAVSALAAATAGIGTGISLNVAGSVKNVFLNSAGTWNVDNTGDLTATGTIILKWTKM